MNLEAILRQIIGLLEQADINYMLTGSFAGAYHGVPRATQDIDVVIDGSEDQIVRFVRGAEASGFYVSEEGAKGAVATRGQFNVIDRSTGWKVDLIMRKERPFSQEEFSRRTREDVLGFPIYMATAEDTILAKLEWARLGESERQLRDVIGIIRSRDEGLDREYIEKWAKELDVLEEWKVAEQRAAEE